MTGPIPRGVRNAFRNPLRTIAVVVILGLSLGLVLVMLAAQSAVDKRIAEVKTSIGNTVSVAPAGARGFLGGGEPLTNAQIDLLAALSHVTRVDATIDAQIRPETDTSLESPIEAGTLGQRQGRIFNVGGPAGGTQSAGTFTPPIFGTGTNNASIGGGQLGGTLTLTDGAAFDAAADTDVALVGESLAEKNSLSVGSTFTAYETTITVSGIFDAGNEFANNALVFPLKTLQRLSEQTDQVTAMTVRVDSIDNLAAVTGAVKERLGDAADVTSSEDTVIEAVKPLENIRTIATTSLWGALGAATVITLLTMVMIVRERRKEIAVLKALGAGETTVVTQFVTESIALSLLGSVVGTVLGLVFSNPIVRALVTSSAGNGGPEIGASGPGPGGTRAIGEGAVRIAVGGFRAVRGAVQDLAAVIDIRLILIGVAAAIVVAIIGSALPAWLIAKIRPAEVLRND